MNQRNKAGRPIQPKQNPQQANVKRPATPPVYCPQPAPKCLQAKMSGSQPPAPKSRQTPQAPPPYRPQPVPRVLQPKKPCVQPPVKQPLPAPAAPPVYSPQPEPKVLQSKTAQARGGAMQPRHEAQQTQPRPGAPTHTQPPTPLESLRARLSTPANSKPVIKAATVQRSVIQALWLTDGTTGEWKPGKGDAKEGTYQHVGDHLFRRVTSVSNSNASSSSSSGPLGEDLYRWNPAEDQLQSIPITKLNRQVLEAGGFKQAVPFKRTPAKEKESTNLTLYGLQTNPTRYIKYKIKKAEAVLIDQDANTSTPVNLPVPFDRNSPFIEHNGEKFFRIAPTQTGLEETGTIFFYLKGQESNAEQTKSPRESRTRIAAGPSKEISDLITAENILVWEPIKTRSMSQKSVMNNVSAAEEAALLGMTSGKWQWLHLIAHSMGTLGNPQISRNLVAGTAACNGAMALLEKCIKEYVKATGQSLRVRVVAQLIRPTHVASAITYEVENSGVSGKATFYFDPLDPNKAAIQYADHYAAVLIDKLSKESQRPGTPKRKILVRALTGEQHCETPERLVPPSSPSTPFVSPISLTNLYKQPAPLTPPPTPLSNNPASSPTPNLPAPSSNAPSDSNQDLQRLTEGIATKRIAVYRGSKEHKTKVPKTKEPKTKEPPK